MWSVSLQLHLLTEDFKLHLVPHWGRGDTYKLSVEGLLRNEVEEGLTLGHQGRGVDSFVETVASMLLTEHEVWLELIFKPDDQIGLPFRVLPISNVRRTAEGSLIQEVSTQEGSRQQLYQEAAIQHLPRELDEEHIAHVSLPKEYPCQLLLKIESDLVEADAYDPLKTQWMMDQVTRQNRNAPTFDSREANRTHRLRILQAALPIGWTAREIYYDSNRFLGEYYRIWRELRFLHFRASMRERAEGALHQVLSMAGTVCGFNASVATSGLCTPLEVEEIIRDFEASRITFSKVYDIIYERQDSPYSRERCLF